MLIFLLFIIWTFSYSCSIFSLPITVPYPFTNMPDLCFRYQRPKHSGAGAHRACSHVPQSYMLLTVKWWMTEKWHSQHKGMILSCTMSSNSFPWSLNPYREQGNQLYQAAVDKMEIDYPPHQQNKATWPADPVDSCPSDHRSSCIGSWMHARNMIRHTTTDRQSAVKAGKTCFLLSVSCRARNKFTSLGDR